MEQASYSASTKIVKVPGIKSPVAEKFRLLGITTLGDLVEQRSYPQLKRMRQIGPASLQILLDALTQAGLYLGEYPVACPRLPQQEVDSLQSVIDAWIEKHHPNAWAERHLHNPGAYGLYLSLQLEALDHLPVALDERQEHRHRVVRLMNRYRREVKYAQSRDALRDGALVRG